MLHQIIKTSLVILSILSTQSIAAKNNITCDLQELDGGLYGPQAYGPYDYTNPNHKNKLPIVIGAHFTSDVERLIRGSTSSTPHADIRYTLHAIPNYHPALYAISKLERREGIVKKTMYSSNCYFKRAIYFQPKDAISRMLFGMHLHLSKKFKEAEVQYINALDIQPENPEIHYNLGLLYVDLNDIKKAKYHADIAYGKGYPLRGLANKIKLLK